MIHEHFDCTFYLVRHPRCETNDNRQLIGGLNRFTRVTELGKRQQEALIKRLVAMELQFDAMLCSQTVRTKTMTAAVAQNVGFDPKRIKSSKELNERGQGEWEDRVRTEVWTPAVINKMNLRTIDFQPPGGEALRHVGRRQLQFLERAVLYNPEMLELAKDRPLKVFVGTHGLALQALLRETLNFDSSLVWRWPIENCSLTILRFTRDGWFPGCINDTGHLVGIG